MLRRLTIWHWIIVSLLVLLVVQYIYNAREKEDLKRQASEVLQEQVDRLKAEISSITLNLTKSLERSLFS